MIRLNNFWYISISIFLKSGTFWWIIWLLKKAINVSGFSTDFNLFCFCFDVIFIISCLFINNYWIMEDIFSLYMHTIYTIGRQLSKEIMKVLLILFNALMLSALMKLNRQLSCEKLCRISRPSLNLILFSIKYEM